MEKIQISFMKEIKYRDFLIIMTLVSESLQKEEFESVIMKRTADRFIAHAKKMLKKNEVKTSHPLTKVINDNISMRTKYLSSLRLRIDSFMDSHKSEERIAAKKLKFWLRQYKKKLYPPTNFAQTHYVKILMDDFQKEAYIREAISVLQLDDLLQEIAKITTEIDKSNVARIKCLTKNAIACKDLRDEAYLIFQTLIQVMGSHHKMSNSETEVRDMERLSFYIKEQLVLVRGIARSNKTRRNNQKEQATAERDLINSELKEGEQEQTNLPMVIYNGLEMPEYMKLPDSTDQLFVYTTNETTTATPPGRKSLMTPSTNLDTNNYLSNSSTPNNDKRKAEKDGNVKLPLVGSN